MRSAPEILISESSGISECLDRLAAHKRSVRPLSTYRLQFNADFTFLHAQRLIGYLHALGISHVYSSPVLQARAGSRHGYDITNHNSLNPDVGSYEDLQALVRELKNYGMGQVLDFVPNHMGVGLGSNIWWNDVLANGRASEFAEFFDIDWKPLKPELHNKILLPILGDQYGAELETGRIRLTLDNKGFHIEYFDNKLPIDPRTIPLIFSGGPGDLPGNESQYSEFRGVLAGLRHLPSHSTTEGELVRQRRRAIPPLTEALQRLIEQPGEIRSFVEKAVEQGQ